MTNEIEDQAAVADMEQAHDGIVDTQAEAAPLAQTAKLVLKRGGVLTDVEFIVHPPATIGRFDPSIGPIDVDLGPQPEGAYVSRKHARIVCEDGVWKVVDLGSSNGTFVLHDDFERVEEAELVNGQEFALGNARFVFQLE
ncbi:MAG: FHA domain-containing protein [Fimbriimonas sp.]|nr:FHA domain-containing protein [Fimbriimonas sp.]